MGQMDQKPRNAASDLEARFTSPDVEAGTWVYWWWLNGCVSREGIVRELDEFKEKGISGAIVFHAGNGDTPFKIPFMSERWRDLFKFAVREAAERGITISLNVCEGWNAGGPWVTEEHAPMTLQHVRMELEGPAKVDAVFPDFPKTDHAARLFTFAWKNDADIRVVGQYVDLTGLVSAEGRLRWEVPEGKWTVVHFGRYVSRHGFTKLTNDREWFPRRYFETNEMDAEGMRIHFDHTAGIAIRDSAEYAGRNFKYLHIDSGETGHPDWVNGFFEPLRKAVRL